MKLALTEKQLSNIINKMDDLDEQESTSTEPSAPDNPEYPEVGHWESGIVRGVANEIDVKKKWADHETAVPKRGHANPLK